MAYLHCHKCGWSQDDFWNWTIIWKYLLKWKSRPFGYNPLSMILEYIAEYWKPRYIGMDSHWLKEHGISGNRVHSWWLLKYEIKHQFRKFKYMKYKTYESYKKVYDSGLLECPRCKCKTEMDID